MYVFNQSHTAQFFFGIIHGCMFLLLLRAILMPFIEVDAEKIIYCIRKFPLYMENTL